jgi:hypothetical protein
MHARGAGTIDKPRAPLDRLDADLRVARPEHENLVCWVITFLHLERQTFTLAGELCCKVLFSQIDVGLVNHVPTVPKHLVDGPPHAEKTVPGCFCRH